MLEKLENTSATQYKYLVHEDITTATRLRKLIHNNDLYDAVVVITGLRTMCKHYSPDSYCLAYKEQKDLNNYKEAFDVVILALEREINKLKEIEINE